jgi:hypothetical protein
MPLWKKLAFAGTVLFVLFALGGFFVAPPIVKARILRELSRRLGREVSVGAVSVNPFELAVSIRDLRILDKDGKPFASWDRANFNYRFTSLLSHDFVFDELSFENPYARFVINENGTLNIDDLLKIFRAAPAEAPAGPPAVWRFEAVRVTGARVGFTDRGRVPVFETTVGPFALNLDRFSTSPHSESPYGFDGRTESGETFAWTGRITSNPLKSSGELTLGGIILPKYRPYYQTGRPFEVREGKVSLKAAYDLAWTETERVMRVKGASLTLENAVIGRPGVEEPDIEVKSLKVGNADIDLINIEAKIETIALEGGHVLIRHDPAHGGVNLHQMIQPFMEGPPSTGPPASISVGTLSMSGVDVDAEDLAPGRPFKVHAHDVSFTVSGIENKPGTKCPTSLSARMGDAGTVKVGGSFSSDFHEGDLDVEVSDVDIRATDSYLDPVARVRIAGGTVGAKGHVRFELPDQGAMAFSYLGDLRLKDVALVDAETAQDLFRMAIFQIAPLSIGLNPMKIAVGEVAIGAPQLKIGIRPDRTIDLMNVLVAASEPAAGSKPAAAGGPLPTVKIDAVRVQNGSIRIDDASISPSVSLGLTRLTGTVKGISTDQLARANVDLTAMLDGVAPLSIAGQINPIARKDFTDLTLKTTGIDLLAYSPYAGKYIGYGIGKGKMGADLSYVISERRFKSNNVFTIDQFELGQKIESPDAVRLPVKLAIAVLRDRNGQIVLDVPAEGSVDDPEFRLGKVIVRAVVNVLTKIVTSPFRLLAGAFGSGPDENIEYQEFALGSADLPATEQQKLDVVAKSMTERPELTLEIQGSVEPGGDAAALRKTRLERLVRTAKWKSVSATNPALASPDAVTVGPEEYPRWLAAAYDGAFPPPPPAPAPAPPTTGEMESRLGETITIAPDDLRALSADRAKSVRDYLTENGQVPAERVFMAEAAAKDAHEPAPRVWLELK